MWIARVGHLHMEGVLVSVGIDGDRLYSHPPRGLDDSTGDFAAIGDQNALEHAGPRPRNAGPWALRRRAGIVNATLYGFAAYPTKTPGLRGAAGRSRQMRTTDCARRRPARTRQHALAPPAHGVGDDPLQNLGVDVAVIGERPRREAGVVGAARSKLIPDRSMASTSARTFPIAPAGMVSPSRMRHC